MDQRTLNIILIAAGAICLVMGVIFLVADYGFYNSPRFTYGNCTVLKYSIAPMEACPWPDQCYTTYCIDIWVNWVPDRGTSHHVYAPPQSHVFPHMKGCWTTETYDAIETTLDHYYPIGATKPCYSASVGNVAFYNKDHSTSVTFGLKVCYIGSFILAAIFALIAIGFAVFTRGCNRTHLYDAVI